jgi:hypothetical protein
MDYSARGDRLHLSRATFARRKTTVNLNGTVSRTASLQVQAESKDPSEIETIANAFGAMPQASPWRRGDIHRHRPRSTTNPNSRLRQHLSRVKGTEWRTVQANVDASPSHIALRNAVSRREAIAPGEFIIDLGRSMGIPGYGPFN